MHALKMQGHAAVPTGLVEMSLWQGRHTISSCLRCEAVAGVHLETKQKSQVSCVVIVSMCIPLPWTQAKRVQQHVLCLAHAHTLNIALNPYRQALFYNRIPFLRDAMLCNCE